MNTRESTYQHFGPIFLESMNLVLLEEINHLRNNQGMPEITEQSLLDKLNNHLTELEPYDWMGVPDV